MRGRGRHISVSLRGVTASQVGIGGLVEVCGVGSIDGVGFTDGAGNVDGMGTIDVIGIVGSGGVELLEAIGDVGDIGRA